MDGRLELTSSELRDPHCDSRSCDNRVVGLLSSSYRSLCRLNDLMFCLSKLISLRVVFQISRHKPTTPVPK